MDKLSQAQHELREMDTLAAGDSPIHRLHPLCKLLVTIFYIITVVSFPKYDIESTGKAIHKITHVWNLSDVRGYSRTPNL